MLYAPTGPVTYEEPRWTDGPYEVGDVLECTLRHASSRVTRFRLLLGCHEFFDPFYSSRVVSSFPDIWYQSSDGDNGFSATTSYLTCDPVELYPYLVDYRYPTARMQNKDYEHQ